VLLRFKLLYKHELPLQCPAVYRLHACAALLNAHYTSLSAMACSSSKSTARSMICLVSVLFFCVTARTCASRRVLQERPPAGPGPSAHASTSASPHPACSPSRPGAPARRVSVVGAPARHQPLADVIDEWRHARSGSACANVATSQSKTTMRRCGAMQSTKQGICITITRSTTAREVCQSTPPVYIAYLSHI